MKAFIVVSVCALFLAVGSMGAAFAEEGSGKQAESEASTTKKKPRKKRELMCKECGKPEKHCECEHKEGAKGEHKEDQEHKD